MRRFVSAAASVLLVSRFTTAIDLDLNSVDSIKSSAKTIAEDLIKTYYTNPEIIGLLPDDYYWWESGVMWDSLVNYWFLTGDDQFNNITSQGLLYQIGSNDDFMPVNQSKNLGNDDQAGWALAALSAAERQFPNPPAGKPQWLDLAKTVFDEQVVRWDISSCDGGIRWQIFAFNNGYNYKNANPYFFLLAARLGQYTGNQTYIDWATKQYDWASSTLMEDFAVYDGADTTESCADPNKVQFSFNQAGYLYGSAILYNMTSSDTWRTRVQGHLDHFSNFFRGSNGEDEGNILTEVACEPNGNCNTDQRALKSLTSRWMSQTVVSAPFTSSKITPWLKDSAAAAAKTCTGGSDGAACGMKWYTAAFGNSTGAGEQISALEVIQQNLNGPGRALATVNSTASGSSTGSGSSNSTGSGSTTSGTGTSASGTSVPGTGAAAHVQISLGAAIIVGFAFMDSVWRWM